MTSFSKTCFPKNRDRFSDERGITLQTLIITATLVAVAVVASVMIVAVSRSSGEGLESSGKAGIEAPCRPWEVYKVSLAAKGYGGTQGYGGVFSSKIGCMAVCYYSNSSIIFFPHAQHVANRDTYSVGALDKSTWLPSGLLISTLEYDDSNRAPGAREVRLGVAYNRVAPDDADDPDEFFPDFGYYRFYPQRSDAPHQRVWNSRDADPIIRMVGSNGDYIGGTLINPVERNDWPGTPIPLEWRGITHAGRWSRGIPWSASLHVYEVNFWSPENANFRDRDEEWMVRADPGREVCEIVDRANNDEIMLTSGREYDPSNPYP